MTPATVLIAGGGTGGHVVPSLALAEALRSAAPDLRVEFLGTSRGLEATLVPAAGWTLHTVDTVPLTRRLSADTLRVPLVLLRAARQARNLLLSRNAVAAVVFGGYVSVPLTLAARWAHIPLLVHEQNAVPGVANRLAGRWAQVVALTHEDSGFGTGKRVVTGNPVRPGLLPEVIAAGRGEGVRAFDLDPDRTTLLVFGGSQGAQRINTAAVESAPLWAKPGQLQILHAAGRRNFAEVRAAWDTVLTGRTEVPQVRCVEFIERMDLAYAAADVVLCRSGASTLAELTVAGKPSVLVPYPHATADHQTANADSLAEVGGAVVIPDEQLTAQRLVDSTEPLLTDEPRRTAMAAAARNAGRPDAAQRLAALVLQIAGPAVGVAA